MPEVKLVILTFIEYINLTLLLVEAEASQD
jgi:hypothetical protein